MITQRKNTKWLRRATLALAGVLVAGAAIWVFQPRPLQVETASVTVGRFEQTIEEDGQWRLKQRYVIAAPTAAELARPTLKVGDAVKAGEVVATLAPVAPQLIDARTRLVLQQRMGSADAARRAASAQVERLETARAQAALEAERAGQLARERFIAPSARDQADLALRAAQQALLAGQAELRASEFALAEARAALTQTDPVNGQPAAALWSMKSPIDGRVIKLHLDSEATVQPGQALLEIGDTTAVEAVIDVLSTDVAQIAPGAPVRLSQGSSAPVLQGRVARIEPVAFTKVSALGVEEQRVRVIVDALPVADAQPVWNAIGEGFRVDARITVAQQDSALLVPTAALVRDDGQWRVLVVEAGRTQARAVTVLDRNAGTARVEAGAAGGVKEGDLVVLYPGTTIRPGQAVKTRD